MKSVKLVASCIVLGSLAACGSSSNSSDSDVRNALNLIEKVNSGEITSIEAADLPETAEMSGFIGVSMNDGEDDEILLGSVSVTADFGAGSLTGTADRFSIQEGRYNAEDELIGGRRVASLNGELDVTGNITGTTFDYDMSGELTGRVSGEDITADVALGGTGVFAHVDGNLTGLSIDPSGTAIISVGGDVVDVTLDEGIMIIEE